MLLCGFCHNKLTRKHLCAQYVTYDILRSLFLRVLFDTQPKNAGELYVNVMKTIETENLFSQSKGLSHMLDPYLIHFTNEFDVS